MAVRSTHSLAACSSTVRADIFVLGAKSPAGRSLLSTRYVSLVILRVLYMIITPAKTHGWLVFRRHFEQTEQRYF